MERMEDYLEEEALEELGKELGGMGLLEMGVMGAAVLEDP